MAPPYVFRALVFGLVTFAVVAGLDWIAVDVLRWGWLQDPTHVRFAWPPPHFQDHKFVLGCSCAGALLGQSFDRAAPVGWWRVVGLAVVFGLASLVGAPISLFIWDWLGLIGWLVGGSALVLIVADAIGKP